MNVIIEAATELTAHYQRNRLQAPKGVAVPVWSPRGLVFWEAVAAQMAAFGCPPGVQVITTQAEHFTVVVPDLALPS
jgi:hypothetical protein